MIGFVNINKPQGMTSNDVVIKVRGALKAISGDKKLKVGHLGTLDPLATGVLPIAVGKATRLFDILLNKTKTYVATFKFGETTPTLDKGSEICQRHDICLSESDVLAAARKFVGVISQLPPQYSAKSVGGKRAYDIAREGGVAELTPKNVTVYSIDRLNMENLSENEYAFRIVCSSGTYIRALARDIAEELGTVGYMTSLLRTASGPFALKDSASPTEFSDDPISRLLPVEYALNDIPRFKLDLPEATLALNGVPIYVPYEDGRYVVNCEYTLLGIGRVYDNSLKLEIRL